MQGVPVQSLVGKLIPNWVAWPKEKKERKEKNNKNVNMHVFMKINFIFHNN